MSESVDGDKAVSPDKDHDDDVEIMGETARQLDFDGKGEKQESKTGSESSFDADLEQALNASKTQTPHAFTEEEELAQVKKALENSLSDA